MPINIENEVITSWIWFGARGTPDIWWLPGEILRDIPNCDASDVIVNFFECDTVNNFAEELR